MTALAALVDSLQARALPEDIAEIVLGAMGESLEPGERKLLEQAAAHSLFRRLGQATSMPDDFQRPAGAARQLRKAAQLFHGVAFTPEECVQPARVHAILAAISLQIRRTPGHGGFRDDRLNRRARAEAGLELNHRQYNKRWRFLGRLEAKIQILAREWRKYGLARVAKSSLATRLTHADFGADLPAAACVAYMTARMNRRSIFTNASQDRAYDEVAAMLLGKCSTRWFAIAHVYPAAPVLARLTEEEKGRLLGLAFQTLHEAAALLEETWRTTEVDLATMIVRRGNDSSTWNLAAGAWNKARDQWISLVHALGMSRLLNDVCPGKAMRLMAADVAAWHRSTGGDVDPATEVWAALPLPWDVIQGRARCNQFDIQQACARFGVDPATWTGPKPAADPVPFQPTPELVHGVAVASAELAAVLRKAGWFSGKGTAREAGRPVEVERDAAGFAMGARDADE